MLMTSDLTWKFISILEIIESAVSGWKILDIGIAIIHLSNATR